MGDTANSTEKAPKKSLFKGLKSEFRKIVWPEKKLLGKQTTAVLIISVLLGVVIAGIDLCIKFGIEKILLIG